MSYRIPCQAKGGTRIDYVVPSYDEMTLDQYRDLAPLIGKYIGEDATIDYKISVVNGLSALA